MARRPGGHLTFDRVIACITSIQAASKRIEALEIEIIDDREIDTRIAEIEAGIEWPPNMRGLVEGGR